MNFSKKTILITGGTGSFGINFTRYILKNLNFKKIIIFSRDEFKQYEMKSELSQLKNFKSLRFFIGDIRDKDRLGFALRNVNYLVHAAAIKQIDSAEYNPIEYIKTNIVGSQNVIEQCINNNVEKVIALSTDKASSPINLYGATKLCADKLFISANNFYGKATFSVVRYGNVNFSRGSVIPLFIKQSKKKVLSITSADMTRFSISLKESIKLVIWSLQNLCGGETVIPKIKSYKIKDLAKVICADCKIKIIGKRPGEKTHEEMISENDDNVKIELKDKYILINQALLPTYKKMLKKFRGKILNSNFSFCSNKNLFLSKVEIKKIIDTFDANKFA